MNPRPRLTFGTIYTGVGGTTLGLESALGWRPLWHVENDPARAAVLKQWWPQVPNYHDAFRWREWDGGLVPVPDFVYVEPPFTSKQFVAPALDVLSVLAPKFMVLELSTGPQYQPVFEYVLGRLFQAHYRVLCFAVKYLTSGMVYLPGQEPRMVHSGYRTRAIFSGVHDPNPPEPDVRDVLYRMHLGPGGWEYGLSWEDEKQVPVLDLEVARGLTPGWTEAAGDMYQRRQALLDLCSPVVAAWIAERVVGDGPPRVPAEMLVNNDGAKAVELVIS